MRYRVILEIMDTNERARTASYAFHPEDVVLSDRDQLHVVVDNLADNMGVPK